MYPASNNSQVNNASPPQAWTFDYSMVDDPYDGIDNATTVDKHSHNNVFVAATEHEVDYGLTAAPTGVTIVQIDLYARVWERSFNSKTCDSSVKIYVRPGGGTKYYGAATAIVGTGNAGGDNPQDLPVATWATNPSTGVAWTLADLGSLKVGLYTLDVDSGNWTGHNSFFNLTSLYVKVTGTPGAANVEPTRGMASQFLREFRKPLRQARIVVPAQYATFEPGDEMDAYQTKNGPAPDASGWRNAVGSYRDLALLSSEVDPIGRTVELLCEDKKETECRYWLGAQQDLGVGDEAQGVACVSPGGGLPVVNRVAADYEQREGDLLWVPVSTLKGRYGKHGWLVETSQQRNLVLNSTFSQGVTNVFTNWTKVTAGGGSIVEDTVYAFDAAGLRRSIKFTMGTDPTTPTDYSYAYTDNIALTANDVIRLRFILRNTVTANLKGAGIAFSRLSDGTFYNFEKGTWDAANNNQNWHALLHAPTIRTIYRTQSGKSLLVTIPTTTNYRLYVGLTKDANAQVHFFSAELLRIVGAVTQAPDVRSSVIVTTSAAVTRGAESAYISNYPSAPIMNIFQSGATAGAFHGRCTFECVPHWSHGDMADGDTKQMFVSLYTGITFHDSMYYKRVDSNTGRWIYSRRIPSGTNGSYTENDAFVQVTGSDLPSSKSQVVNGDGEAAVSTEWTLSSGSVTLDSSAVQFRSQTKSLRMISSSGLQSAYQDVTISGEGEPLAFSWSIYGGGGSVQAAVYVQDQESFNYLKNDGTWTPTRTAVDSTTTASWKSTGPQGNAGFQHSPSGSFFFDPEILGGKHVLRITLEISATGTVYFDDINMLVRSKRVRCLARWTSDRGELGLVARTLDLFVDSGPAHENGAQGTFTKGTGVVWGNDYTDPVAWTGLQNVTISNQNGLTETGTGNVWTGSAISSHGIGQILGGGGESAADGFVEWSQLGIGYQMVGLSKTQDLTTHTYDGIEFAAYDEAGQFKVYEDGLLKFGPVAMTTGSRLRVQRVGTEVKYYINGALQYTSAKAPTANKVYYAVAAIYLTTGAVSGFDQACLWGTTITDSVGSLTNRVGRSQDDNRNQVVIFSPANSFGRVWPSIAQNKWGSCHYRWIEWSDRIFYDEETGKWV